jgi:cytochrome c oxidase assembly protein subunit 15
LAIGAIPGERAAAPELRLRPVRTWLYAIALLVLLMVAVGGVTRLTGSGLSITEWKPLHGIIPPLTDAEWRAEFAAYQQIPQYSEVNAWMTLDDFKGIFWWEWAHRALGRLIGLAFAIPFVIFLVQRRFTAGLAWPLAGLFVLGGFQGFLGWWMVSSGLSELTSVSQYRLAAHLLAAAVLFVALVWVARRLIPRRRLFPVPIAEPPQDPARWPAATLLVLILLQIVFGAFVAGLDAGVGWNTWPMMEGALIPPNLLPLQPMWRNLFENPLTVQFLHRVIAYLILGWSVFLLWRQSRRGGFGGAHGWLPRLAFLIVLQVVLGVATLLALVPLSLALGHQVLAFMLAGAVTAYLADLTPPRPSSTG